MRIDQSRFEAWNYNHERYRLAYHLNIVPEKRGDALERGLALHLCAEGAYKGWSDGEIMARMAEEDISPDNQQIGFLLVPFYLAHHEASGYQKVRCEEEFIVPIPESVRLNATESWSGNVELSTTNHSIVGRLDGILWDTHRYVVEEIKTCNGKYKRETREKWIAEEWRTRIQAPFIVMGARSLSPEFQDIDTVLVRTIMEGDPPQVLTHYETVDEYRLQYARIMAAQTCDEIEMYREKWPDGPWHHAYHREYKGYGCTTEGACPYEGICGTRVNGIPEGFVKRKEHLSLMEEK